MFPLGVTHYLLGGILVGLGVALIFLYTGIYAGASSFFTTTLSWFFSDFKRKNWMEQRGWRLVFTIGLILGALLYALSNEFFVTQVSGWRLFMGGLLVGFGTRYARGCTSGHGICGNASLAPASIKATITFLLIAILTAHLVEVLL